MVLFGQTISIKEYPNVRTDQSVLVEAGLKTYYAIPKPVKVRWSYYVSGAPELETVYGVTSLKERVTITGLMPNMPYVICGQLIYEDMGAEGDKQSVEVKTNTMTDCDMVLQETSPSVISVAVRGLPEFSYDVQIKFSYKPKGTPSWTVHGVHTIEAGSVGDVKHIFTGLRQNTEYAISAILFKVGGGHSSRFKELTLIATTDIYTQGIKAVPYIESWMTVPGAGVGYIKYGVDYHDTREYSIHLLKSTDGEEFTDMGELDPYASDKALISGDIGSKAYYKLAVYESGGMYNPSAVVEATFEAVPWTDRVAGEPIDLVADDIKRQAQAILAMHDYLVAVSTVTPTQAYACKVLRANLAEIFSGARVKGSKVSFPSLLGTAARSFLTGGEFSIGGKGQPITAAKFNAMAGYVLSALATLGG